MECKAKKFCILCKKIIVLIETSWNVKQDISGVILKNDVSINRNIVECKVEATAGEKHYREVLIETSWNVKTVRGGNRHRIE